VRISSPVKPNSDIVYAGDDVKAGAIIAGKGTLLSAPHLGILAGQGIADVAVYKKPVIYILNTGSELTEVGTPLKPAMIYNSNVYTLSGYLRDMGAEPYNAGIVEDDPDAIASRINAALEASDMVITTGGASVGDYDWAVTSASLLGAEILFWKVSMKPADRSWPPPRTAS
jgi:molybdopterin molybdotransferase